MSPRMPADWAEHMNVMDGENSDKENAPSESPGIGLKSD